MIEQSGIFTYLLTFSFANLIWEELPCIVNKLNNLDLSDEEAEKLSYQERCNLLNNNRVILVARNFWYEI